jgi:hypothetical protein
MCWYLAAGLRLAGEDELSNWIENSVLALLHENGFYEYYSPETGRGLGEDRFGWTAALAIELASRRIAESDAD